MMSPAALGSWRLRQARALLLWKRPSDSSHRCFATPAWRALCHRLLQAGHPSPRTQNRARVDDDGADGSQSAPSGGQKGDLPLPVRTYIIRYYDAACAAQRGGDSELRPARSQRAGSVPAWLESPAGGTAHRSSLAEQQADSSSRRRGRRRPRMADAHAHGSDLRRLRACGGASWP
jgi:hypothetical protein